MTFTSNLESLCEDRRKKEKVLSAVWPSNSDTPLHSGGKEGEAILLTVSFNLFSL